MYKIIGADKKEYGPVSAEQLCDWIQQGRVSAQTLVQAEGQTDWRPVIAFPEFAEALAAKSPATPPPLAAGGTTGVAREILDRDYDLDLGGCISRGWNLLQKNMGLLIGATLIYLGISIALSLLGAIPLIGVIFSLLSLFVTAPLMAGLFYVTLQAIRGQPATAGDVFEGFRRAFVQLVLGYIVSTIHCFHHSYRALRYSGRHRGVGNALAIADSKSGPQPRCDLGHGRRRVGLFVAGNFPDRELDFHPAVNCGQAPGLLAGHADQLEDGAQTLVATFRSYHPRWSAEHGRNSLVLCWLAFLHASRFCGHDVRL